MSEWSTTMALHLWSALRLSFASLRDVIGALFGRGRTRACATHAAW